MPSFVRDTKKAEDLWGVTGFGSARGRCETGEASIQVSKILANNGEEYCASHGEYLMLPIRLESIKKDKGDFIAEKNGLRAFLRLDRITVPLVVTKRACRSILAENNGLRRLIRKGPQCKDVTVEVKPQSSHYHKGVRCVTVVATRGKEISFPVKYLADINAEHLPDWLESTDNSPEKEAETSVSDFMQRARTTRAATQENAATI